LPSTFCSEKSTCGCSPENEKRFAINCYGLDLGLIYDKTHCWEESDSPCEEKCIEIGDEEECTEYPHGRISNIMRACAKLVVFKGARVVNDEFLYDDDPIVLFSRQRKDLPYFENCLIKNPLHCPAENTFLKCSKTCVRVGGVGKTGTSEYWTGGQYLNVTHEENPTNKTGCTGCQGWKADVLGEEWESQEYGFGFSPCKFDELSQIEGECGSAEETDFPVNDRVLAGYALDSEETWLLNEEEEVFPIVRQAIIDNDPLGAFPHVVYVHFELRHSLIKCVGYGSGRLNYGLSEKEEREKAVAVQVALGFSCQLCGLEPEKACIKLYEE
jgi:hypothetical protein